MAEDKSASQQSGSQCAWPGRKWVYHVTPEEFAVMQLAGELELWENDFTSLEPRWWTQAWGKDGRYICKCGKPNTEAKTSHENVGNPERHPDSV